MLFPLLCAVDASPFHEVPATFTRNLISIVTTDDAGRPHRMLVDSGSPISFLRVRSAKPDEVVPLEFGRGKQRFRIKASTVAASNFAGRSEGILGLDFLQRHSIAIDYERGRLWIGTQGGKAAESFLKRYVGTSRPVQEIPLRRIQGGYYGIDVALNGFRCESVLDTGSEGFSLIADRGEGWKLDPVGEKQVFTHAGMSVAKEFLASTAKVGHLTLHAQPVTCVIPSAILFEPWEVDSVVSPSVFPSKLTILDFPNRRLSFIPSDSGNGAALLRHLLTLPVHRTGSQFSLQGYFVDLPPVLAFQHFPTGSAESAPGMNVMGRDGAIKFKPAQRNAVLTKISGRPIRSILQSYREAQSGSRSAYAAILALYRSQRREAECTLLIGGRPAMYRGVPFTLSPAP